MRSFFLERRFREVGTAVPDWNASLHIRGLPARRARLVIFGILIYRPDVVFPLAARMFFAVSMAVIMAWS